MAPGKHFIGNEAQLIRIGRRGSGGHWEIASQGCVVSRGVLRTYTQETRCGRIRIGRLSRRGPSFARRTIYKSTAVSRESDVAHRVSANQRFANAMAAFSSARCTPASRTASRRRLRRHCHLPKLCSARPLITSFHRKGSDGDAKRARGAGSIYKREDVYWCKYHDRGIAVRKSTGETSARRAQTFRNSPTALRTS
jgi:hypothetical protein